MQTKCPLRESWKKLKHTFSPLGPAGPCQEGAENV